MISVIICSVNPQLSEGAINNIRETINVPHEVLVFNNKTASNKISDVYNDQAQLAKYDHLVFMHEDIKFHSPDWGEFLVETLNMNDVGMVGICGGKYYPDVPCSWIDIPQHLRRASMKSRVDGELVEYDVRDIHENNISETVTLDGAFLAMKRSTWQQFPFSSSHERSFHFYDIDLSLRVGEDMKLVIDHRIKLEHFSTGSFNKAWLKDAFAFYHQKYRRFSAKNLSSENADFLEDFAFKRMLERIIECRSFLYLIKLFGTKPRLFIKNTIFLLQLLF